MATPFSCVQLAYEETPVNENNIGSIVTPYRISTVKRFLPITSAAPALSPQQLDRSDEVRGILGAFSRLVETYNPTGALAERMYLNDLPFLLNCCGLTDTITAGDGSTVKDPANVAIPVGATRHVFTKRAGVTAKTVQMIFAYVANNVFLQGNGYTCTSVGFGSNGEITSAFDGLVLKRLASDPNLTPSFDSPAIPHARRGDLFLTWLASSGIADDFTLNITASANRRRSMGLNPPSYFSDVMEVGDTQVYLTGTLPLAAFSQADWDSMYSSGTFAANAYWKLPVNIGATSYKYQMWIDMPSCQLTDMPPDPLANRQRFGASQSFFAAWDQTAGYDFKITIVNAVSALETYV